MRLADLEHAVTTHEGDFHCSRLNATGETKIVHVRHRVEAPSPVQGLPAIGRLGDFFDTFGSVVFYEAERTGDAAVRIAAPSEWHTLGDDLRDSFDLLSDDERQECLPSWVETCLVIGEMPRTGNYVLMATEGDEAGHVFEFDHDGFEFSRQASDLVDYTHRLLAIDAQRLATFASHLRFVEGDDWMIQWWIEELRDNRGRVVATRA